jgi:hypothetical protein
MPGHHRHDAGITIGARCGGGAAGRPRRLRAARAVQAAELIQGHVQLNLRRLTRAIRQAPRPGEAAAGFLQRVVVPLALTPGVFRPGFLAQRFEDGLQRGGALRRQVTLHPPGAVQGQVQPQPPVTEPAIIIGVRAGAAALHFLGQPGQVRQVRAADGGGQQDRVRVRLLILGELAGPGADLPRPRRRDPSGGEGVADGGVRGDPPCPRHRAGGRALRDPGLPPQPRPR